MKNQKITLLDLGGVVFQSTGISNQKIDWKLISALNHKYGHDLNIGKDKFPDFMKEYNERTNQSLSGQAFLELVFDTLEINTELIEAIREVSDIIIVSDNYRENIEYISQRFDFESWAIQEIYSFDYQMVKANPLFFKRLLVELKEYDKEQMIFIDDSKNKIESAQKNGIKGLLFENNEQLLPIFKAYHETERFLIWGVGKK